MIVLLTIVSAVSALGLVASAITHLNASRPLDETAPGPWGLLRRVEEPRRSLTAEERRWHTTLQRAETDQGIWRDLRHRLDELERTLGGDATAATSTDFDRSELRATISRLEDLLGGKSSSGESPSGGSTDT